MEGFEDFIDNLLVFDMDWFELSVAGFMLFYAFLLVLVVVFNYYKTRTENQNAQPSR